MKLRSIKKIIAGWLFTAAFLSLACQKQAVQNDNSPAQTVVAQTPTEAYKLLYAAVKAKDTGTIKQLVSTNTQGLAGFMAQQQKQPIDKIYENGFTATTFSPTLPEIRAERVKDNFGALEVYNSKDNRWEDLPFVLEDGSWKLAVGDVFKDTYKSPGKGQAELEREASGNGNMMIAPNSNSANVNKMIQMPPVNKAKK